MISVDVREFINNFSAYLKKVKKGERIVLLERNKPVADIMPHNDNVTPIPGWKRKVKMIKIKGLSLADECIKFRRQERY